MLTSSFDYPLPPRAIAQPPARRDRSRMLVLNRASGRTEHRTIRDLPTFLQRGDLIVVNDTKVFRARLRGVVEGRGVEVLLVRPFRFSPSRRPRLRDPLAREEGELEGVGSENRQSKIGNRKCSVWIILAKPARRLRVGASVTVGRMRGTVLGHEPDGSVRIQFDRSAAAVITYANRIGEVPIPPYVLISPPPAGLGSESLWLVRRGRLRGGGTRPTADEHNQSHWKRSGIRLQDYQTIYARHTGSVAAPTAGFHITPRIIRALNKRGVRVARITLHVGLGTFQPIRTEKLEDHTMHAEWVSIPAATARAIASAKAHGTRVIAIGTTTLRALEGVALLSSPSPVCGEGELEGERHTGFVPPTPDEGSHGIGGATSAPKIGNRQSAIENFAAPVSLFITPGFRFRVVDALLTNFHLPRSTLLVLVSAFAAPSDPTLRGRDTILRAYRSALRHGYRFYSFGDAMFIV